MKHRPALPPDIKELMGLVRSGKLFAVQEWIADGKPTMPPKPYWFSPFRVAVETGFHSMIELLLQQGVDADEKDYMLHRAVGAGNFEVIKLLIEYGADLHTVEFDNVCATGHPFIIQYFLDRGLDAETGYPFARALRYPKRRYLSVYMRYRDKIPSFRHQWNLALRHHAYAGNLKWVSLMLWAGGDGHIRLPEIDVEPDPENDRSAIEAAVSMNHVEVVKKIGIDPQRDNIDEMFSDACLHGHVQMVGKLLGLGANPCGKEGSGKPMDRAVWHLRWEMEEHYGIRSEYRAQKALESVVRLADLGARWEPDSSGLRYLRRELCRLSPGFIQSTVMTFHKHQVCSTGVLLKLIGTAQFKEILGFRYQQVVQELKAKK